MVAAVSTSTEDRLSGSAPRSFSIIVRSCRCPYDPRATLEKIGPGSTCLTDDTRVGRQLESSSCHSGMTNRKLAVISIRSVYADDGSQRQEVAIPLRYWRIKTGRATAVQK